MKAEPVGQVGEHLQTVRELVVLDARLHVLDERLLLADISFPHRLQGAGLVDEVVAAGVAEWLSEKPPSSSGRGSG